MTGMTGMTGMVLGLVLLAGCDGVGGVTGAGGGAQAPAGGPFGSVALPGFFDCLREGRGTVIAAHRAGPVPGFPENAVETMANTLANATPVMEIDVAESRDGVLFLFHDRSLSRLTQAEGFVADTDWETIRKLKLKDNDGALTPYSPPALRDVLLWAKANGALLELDRKETTSFRNIIAAVRETGTENHVILISYNDDQAAEIARLAPDLMMTAGANGADDIARLQAAGVDPARIIAWTGTREPNPEGKAAIREGGIEVAFGTLGRPGERLDDRYGDAEFEALVGMGVSLIATDRAGDVADFLSADDAPVRACAG